MTRNKFGNRQTVINGIRFDSKAEGNYYLVLLDKQRREEIQSFTLQPRYLLQRSFKKNGTTYRKIEYVADFEVIYPDGRIEVIDVKPSPDFVTPVYKLKKKLFEKIYPDLSIVEVYARDLKG